MSCAAIIIPTWNNAAFTVRCLESLSKYTTDYVLIWIDNGSEREERKAVENAVESLNIPYKSFSNKENLGFSKAINQGIKIALAGNFDPVVLLNNDVTLTPKWLAKLQAALDKYPKLGIVGSIHDRGSVNGYRRYIASTGFHGDNPEAFFNSLPLIIQRTSTAVPFSCVAIRRKVIEKVGLLDESFSPCLGEDNDYCDRVRIAGWGLAFVVNCFTWHERRASVEKLPNYKIIKHRNERLLKLKRRARLGLMRIGISR